MKFAKQDLLDLIYGEAPEGFRPWPVQSEWLIPPAGPSTRTSCSSTVTASSSCSWSEGATEYQDERPLEFETDEDRGFPRSRPARSPPIPIPSERRHLTMASSKRTSTDHCGQEFLFSTSSPKRRRQHHPHDRQRIVRPSGHQAVRPRRHDGGRLEGTGARSLLPGWCSPLRHHSSSIEEVAKE